MTPILIAGATGAGKSHLALALAQEVDGWVINADSQQVYAPWRVLTARPGPAEEARAPHKLYGHLPLEAAHSAGDWLRALALVLEAARAAGAVPIVTGGTGLYFRALTEGLSPVPPVPAAVRAALAARLECEGLPSLAADLAARDPETMRGTAGALDRANPARVLRALEVLEATGRGLAAWHAEAAPPLLPEAWCHRLVLEAPADWLNRRIEVRFAAMLKGGAIEEVEAVRAAGADPSLPGMKAIGVAEIARYLDGAITLQTAEAEGAAATRRYAKRQRTWFRNQMPGWTRLTPGPDLLDRALATIAGG
ncbi:MAG: tRNA (adenosine(37)-N6)-dimethylallyltransferase MiaA [Pseudomonadota bacterium]